VVVLVAKKNILIKKKNGTTWDELYPITTANNVKTSDGSSVEAHLVENTSHFKEIGAIGKGQIITDFNLATKQGKYIIADVSSGVTNNPPMASWGILEVIVNATTGYLHQKSYSIVDNVVYERNRNESTTWTPWKRIINESGGQMTGILTAQSNTSYTVRQVHNTILSPNDADVNQMQDGDIWIKYK